VANITASRVSMERMRKIRFFQRSGYVSLDLAKGTGEFLRLRKGATMPEGDVSLLSLMSIVERIELNGDGTEPLRAELQAWVAAVRGEGPLVVSGRDGRDALAVALRIMEKIEDHAVAVAGAA
jgi:predicted dehydrogenase